jgi:uncharacterized membrane protein
VDEELRLMLVAMSRRIEGLEREVARLKGAEAGQDHMSFQQQPVSAVSTQPEPETMAPAVAPPRETYRPAPPIIAQKNPSVRDASFESAIGTKWIGRIGMIAILFGVGFLLKYSFDNNLIGETGRIILGILAGILFLGAGEYLSRRRDMKLYAQILTGGGLAALYLSIYAAYAFYKLIPQLPAFAALIAVTTTGITLSVRYNAIVIAAIGVLGGFLTPVMLSTGENQPISLFAYIILLDVGILTMGYMRRWRLLSALSFGLTILMYIGWHLKFYSHDQQLLAFGIATTFFVLYNLFLLFRKTDDDAYDRIFDHGIVSVSIVWYLAVFYDQNQMHNDWYLKSFILALSCVAVLLAGLVLKMDRARKNLIYGYAGWSLVLSVIALLVIFKQQWQAMAIAAEMLVLCFIGLRLKQTPARYASYLLGLIVVALFFREAELHLAPFENYLPLINSRFLICGLLIAAFYGILYQLYRAKELFDGTEKLILPALLILTQVLTVYLISVESTDYFRHAQGSINLLPINSGYAQQLSLSVVWAVYASVLIGVGIAKNHAILRLLGITLIGVTILKVFLLDLSSLRTIYRIVSFVVLGFILLGVSYFYNRFKHRIFGEESSR